MSLHRFIFLIFPPATFLRSISRTVAYNFHWNKTEPTAPDPTAGAHGPRPHLRRSNAYERLPSLNDHTAAYAPMSHNTNTDGLINMMRPSADLNRMSAVAIKSGTAQPTPPPPRSPTTPLSHQANSRMPTTTTEA